MAPMSRPPRMIGEPPRVGRICPCRTVGAMDQKPPLATISARSAVRFLNDAAAMALARDVSVLKNPVPSPRALSTSRPASSTTVTVIGARSARALVWAAFTAVSAISSVMSIMISSAPRTAGPQPPRRAAARERS
jgi:hypothetical protein